MEVIIFFLSSFFGSFSAFFLFHFLTRYNESSFLKQGLSRTLQAVKNKANPPKGTVLHSPTPEEEEKEKERNVINKFEKLSKRLKENVIQDFR